MQHQHPYHQPDLGGGEDDIDDASTLESKSAGGAEGDDAGSVWLPRIVVAGEELESLCRAEMSGGGGTVSPGFPPICLPIARLLCGNHCCVDCGDEEGDRLKYGSIGYGTILCKECAHRHNTMSYEESNIKSLKDEQWNLRSALTILEGSNSRMLDYVKNKPRWRAPRGESYSDDVLAFKQIYMSKAAEEYRKILAKRVDDAFYKRITAIREEDEAMEKRVQRAAEAVASPVDGDPFRRIFEQNNVSAEEIPGFFDGGDVNKAEDDIRNNTISRAGGIISGRSGKTARARGGAKGRNAPLKPLMNRDAPSMDAIKKRINARRNMNSSIVMMEERRATLEGGGPFDDEGFPLLPNGSGGGIDPGAIASCYAPRGSRSHMPSRRGSYSNGGLVGEVGGASIQDHDDQASIGDGSYQRMSYQKKWSAGSHEQHNENRSYISRSRAPPLGTYRRSEASVSAAES